MTAVSGLTVKGTPRKRNYPTDRVQRGSDPMVRIWRYARVDANGCWVWHASRRNGYGSLTIDYQVLYAHRVAYEATKGPIPPGMQLDHLCRNTACCNPDHLEPVTPQINVLRGESPGAKALRRTHCERGHAFEQHGVVRHGRRVCQVCRTAYSAIYRSMTRDERAQRLASGLPVVDPAALDAMCGVTQKAA